MPRFSPRGTQFREREKDTDCAPWSQSWAQGNNIVGTNNAQSPRGCWLKGRRLLRESPWKSMILVRSGEHRWQSAVRNSPFPVRGRAPRRQPARKGRSSGSLIECHRVRQP